MTSFSTNFTSQNGKIQYLSYNEDASCFVVATDRGFMIYNCDPFKERFRRDLSGGVGLIEIYGRSNIVILVGGGSRPIGPNNQVIIWDDRQGKSIAELPFSSEIKAIKCRGDRLIVAENDKVSLYYINKLDFLNKYETGPNPHGLMAMNHPEADFPVLAFPHRIPGKLRLEHLKPSRQNKGLTIDAHTSPLSQITLTQNGRFVATSSERGTLIRIWCTSQGTQLRELRRGLQAATIQSLILHPTGQALAVSSSQGTVHIYSLANKMSAEEDYNRRSTLAFLGGVLPKYFSSEWSMVSFTGFEDVVEPQKIQCAFGYKEPGTMVLIGDQGHYAKFRYTTQESKVIEKKRFWPKPSSPKREQQQASE